MSSLPVDRPPDDALTRMIAAHGMWKYRLHQAIDTGRSGFTVDQVTADDRCPLGQWLHGDEGRRLRGQPHFEQIRSLHQHFHTLTGNVLRLALDGQREQARQAMAAGSEFLTSSAALVTALDAWRGRDAATAQMPAGAATAQSLGGALETAAQADTTAQLGTAFVAQLVGTSLETAAQADVAMHGVTTVGSTMDCLAAAVEELTATIKEISSVSANAVTGTNTMVRDAEVFTSGVTRLTEAIGQIEQVLSLITGIAHQTNLLALNARIEAARAGDAGKGFAVVAGEVKDLARQSAAAAADVTRQIADIRSQATQTIAAMHRFSDGISTTQDTQLVIASAVEEQTAATAEISRSINQAATTGREITDNVAALALAARNTAASAHQLTTHS